MECWEERRFYWWCPVCRVRSHPCHTPEERDRMAELHRRLHDMGGVE